jgi:hypothetical protein
MKNYFMLSAVLLTLGGTSAWASGADKFSADDLVFRCDRVLSGGQRVYAHITSNEASYEKSLGTYDIQSCEGPYHSCFNVVDESGWGFNSSLISLRPTCRKDLLQLEQTGSPMDHVFCQRIN